MHEKPPWKSTEWFRKWMDLNISTDGYGHPVTLKTGPRSPIPNDIVGLHVSHCFIRVSLVEIRLLIQEWNGFNITVYIKCRQTDKWLTDEPKLNWTFGRIQTLDPLIANLVYYHCATAFHIEIKIKSQNTVKTLNIGTPRPATVVVLNIKQFNFPMK